MLPNKYSILGRGGSARPESAVGGLPAPAQQAKGTRRCTILRSGRGPAASNSGEDPLRSIDLKQLNNLPLAKLSETANAMWERIRSSGIDVKVAPTPPQLSPNLVGGSKAPSGAVGTGPDTAELTAVPAGGGSKEQRLMSALAQAQDEKRQLADRSELLRANVSMLEARNAKMARELEAVEAGRASAVRLRDMLLAERDELAAQLKEAQEELQRASDGMEVREGAIELLRQSQQQLQEELRDAVTRLQAVDRSTEDLRRQLASLESARAAAVGERDGLSGHLRELVGMVDQLSGILQGAELLQQGAHAALGSPAAAATATSLPAPAPALTDTAAAASSSSPVVSAASAQLQQLRSTTEGAFAALRVARDELGLLRTENQQLAQRAEALATTNKELTVTAKALRLEMAATRLEAEDQRRELEAVRGREAHLAAALATATSERRAAEAAVAEAEAQREALAAERDGLAAAVAELGAVRDAAAAAGVGLVELAQVSSKLSALKDQLTASRASETDLKRRLATTEVALLDTRRAAAAAETRLAAELDAARRDAAELRASLHARTLATQAARRGGKAVAPAEGQFVNTNRFWVPPEAMFDFVKAVAAREVALVEAKGFLGMAVRTEDANTITVSTHWESVPAFEAWSRSAEARRQHYPAGVFQYVPRRGEGFPEDFMPFKDLSEAVNAKY